MYDVSQGRTLPDSQVGDGGNLRKETGCKGVNGKCMM